MSNPASEKAIIAAFAEANIGYSITDIEGRLIHCSDVYSNHTEIKPDANQEFPTQPWFYLDQSSPETKAKRHKLWRRFVTSGKPWKGIVRWRLKGGQMHYFEGTATTQSDGRIILITNDRTDQIKTNRLTKETKTIQTQTLEALPVFLCVTGTDYRAQYINPLLPTRLGKPARDFIGRSIKSIYGPNLSLIAERLVDTVFESGNSTKPELIAVEGKTSAGSHWLVQAHPLKDRNGLVTSVLTTAVDRTDSVRLRNERIKFADAIHESQKIAALNDFAGSLAHELSNLLHPIAGYARLILREPVTPQHKDYATKINQASLAAGRILRRTLSMAHPDPSEDETCDISKTINDTIAMARDLAPAGLAYCIDIPFTGQGACPPGELRQVLLNILNNAADAMYYQGAIKVKVTGGHARPTDVDMMPTGNEPFLRISIADSGPGIPSSVKARIFDPFFTTKPIGRGTGLGLAVVQGLVMGWGGIVSVTTKPSTGSVFNVWIPQTHRVYDCNQQG